MQSEWNNPGGKFRELGPDQVNDNELLASLISSEIEDKSTLNIMINCWRNSDLLK